MKKERLFYPTIKKPTLLCEGNLRIGNLELCPVIYAGKHARNRGQIQRIEEINLLFKHHENPLDKHCQSCTAEKCCLEKRSDITKLFLAPTPTQEPTHLYGSKE